MPARCLRAPWQVTMTVFFHVWTYGVALVGAIRTVRVPQALPEGRMSGVPEALWPQPRVCRRQRAGKGGTPPTPRPFALRLLVGRAERRGPISPFRAVLRRKGSQMIYRSLTWSTAF